MANVSRPSVHEQQPGLRTVTQVNEAWFDRFE